MSDAKVEELATSGAFIKMTEHSIVDLDVLWVELDQIRPRVWAQDCNEFVDGSGCIAAPTGDHDGNVAAALTVSGPIERLNQDVDLLVQQVKACAAAISKDMGYRPPA
jgi:IclR family KDG regulon transcriptional repressor